MVSDLVFIVDDDEAIRDSVSALVESVGLMACTYSSAEAFLAAVGLTSSEVYEYRRCIISDLRMSGMSGLELQEQLNQSGSRVPIIIVSGFADVQTTVQAMRKGAVTVLEKTHQSSELLAAIHEALDQCPVV